MRTIRQFEIVEALAAHQHFGRAAAALGVSQPSLTRSLKDLEAQLGAALFDRDGVTPTVFGQIVLRHGRPVLLGFAEVKREIVLAKGLEVGQLSLAMAFFPADISGHEAAARLSRRYPNLSLDLRIADWVRAPEAVLSAQADLAFADIRAARSNPEFETIGVRSGPVSFFCAASHPLARRRKVEMSDLLANPWVGPTFPAALTKATPQIRPKADLPCGSVDVATGLFRPRILVESFASAKRIVQGGAALSAGFPFQVARECAAGEFVVLPVETPFMNLDYGFITKRGRALSPAAKAFMQAVKDVESEI